MPSIHATSSVDHEKRVVRFSISMRACGSVPMVIGAPLGYCHYTKIELVRFKCGYCEYYLGKVRLELLQSAVSPLILCDLQGGSLEICRTFVSCCFSCAMLLVDHCRSIALSTL